MQPFKYRSASLLLNLILSSSNLPNSVTAFISDTEAHSKGKGLWYLSGGVVVGFRPYAVLDIAESVLR